MNISEAIAKRKSVRAYLNKPVLADDLAKIVEAGRWAPNAGPFQITVVRNAQLKHKINDRTLPQSTACFCVDWYFRFSVLLLESRYTLMTLKGAISV